MFLCTTTLSSSASLSIKNIDINHLSMLEYFATSQMIGTKSSGVSINTLGLFTRVVDGGSRSLSWCDLRGYAGVLDMRVGARLCRVSVWLWLHVGLI